MPKVFQRAAARRDLIEHYMYLAENVGEPVAERFMVQAEATHAELAEHPEMVSPLALRRPELAMLRKWRVRDFERCLIFYFARPNGISIMRVLHADKDWWRTLGM
jgi:toxin ParE1/3/4